MQAINIDVNLWEASYVVFVMLLLFSVVNYMKLQQKFRACSLYIIAIWLIHVLRKIGNERSPLWSFVRFIHCEDYEENEEQPNIGYSLILRKWQDLNPGYEFRCFVRNNKLIGKCYLLQWVCSLSVYAMKVMI